MATRALCVAAALGFAGSIAWAQPNVVDKRSKDRDKRDKRKKGPEVRDKRGRPGPDTVNSRKMRPRPEPGYRASGYAPRGGPPGTEVTIRGSGFPGGVMVQIGPRRVRPIASSRRQIRFKVPPRVPEGKRWISIVWGGKVDRVGMFEVGKSAPRDNVVDKREPAIRPDPDDRVNWRDRRRRYHRGRPLVSRYFPRKGSPGTRVTIVGRNFAPDAVVTIGGALVKAAKVTPRSVVLRVPRDSGGGLIRLSSGGRAIPVGPFEVVAKYDYEAERRRREAKRRSEAKAAWKARRARLARDRAARRAAFAARQRELAETRAERRRERLRRIRDRWERAFLRDPETRAELALHGDRIARLERMLRLAELEDNGKLVIRIEIALGRERDRHERRMEALVASFEAGGGR